jgi:hypothetical protein
MLFGLREFLCGGSQVLRIHIADGDHVFSSGPGEVILGAMAGRDQSNIQLIARRFRSEKLEARQQER